VRAVQPLVYAATTYRDITDGIMNALKGRAQAHRTAGGRVVVYPASDLHAEQRSRWFERRWRVARHAAGQAVVPPNLTANVARLDAHIRVHARDIEEGRCEVPVAAWYDEHCGAIVDAALDDQFAHVEQAEVWARLPVTELRRALRTLWMRAARRVLVHLRAIAWLREYRGPKPDVLLTAIECIDPADIVDDFRGAGLTTGAANNLLASMTRHDYGERYPIECYPLIPLRDGRVAFVPSCVLYGNWPMAREREAARKDGGAIGNVRDARNTARVAEFLRPQFPGGNVETEVPLRGDDERDITDLDIACVPVDRRDVLVLQLKSFVTPLNLMDLDRGDKNIEEGVAQCQRAVDHLDKVQAALEARTHAPLAATWLLRQCVVTEAYTGTGAPCDAFPVVSLEWLENEGVPALATGGVAELHRRAQSLPDGQAFFNSCRPLHLLINDGDNGLTTGTSWAIWSYTSQ
ncbi:MAG TPA: hypothetical protein VII66_06605, partial [Gemmatimonadaceae bacterium]